MKAPQPYLDLRSPSQRGAPRNALSNRCPCVQSEHTQDSGRRSDTHACSSDPTATQHPHHTPPTSLFAHPCLATRNFRVEQSQSSPSELAFIQHCVLHPPFSLTPKKLTFAQPRPRPTFISDSHTTLKSTCPTSWPIMFTDHPSSSAALSLASESQLSLSTHVSVRCRGGAVAVLRAAFFSFLFHELVTASLSFQATGLNLLGF